MHNTKSILYIIYKLNTRVSVLMCAQIKKKCFKNSNEYDLVNHRKLKCICNNSIIPYAKTHVLYVYYLFNISINKQKRERQSFIKFKQHFIMYKHHSTGATCNLPFYALSQILYTVNEDKISYI